MSRATRRGRRRQAAWFVNTVLGMGPLAFPGPLPGAQPLASQPLAPQGVEPRRATAPATAPAPDDDPIKRSSYRPSRPRPPRPANWVPRSQRGEVPAADASRTEAPRGEVQRDQVGRAEGPVIVSPLPRGPIRRLSLWPPSFG